MRVQSIVSCSSDTSSFSSDFHSDERSLHLLATWSSIEFFFSFHQTWFTCCFLYFCCISLFCNFCFIVKKLIYVIFRIWLFGNPNEKLYQQAKVEKLLENAISISIWIRSTVWLFLFVFLFFIFDFQIRFSKKKRKNKKRTRFGPQQKATELLSLFSTVTKNVVC